MSLHDDLLEQAQVLTTTDTRRPRQVNLRRAVSAAYYALSHLLVAEATRLYVRDDWELAAKLGRTFNHGEMSEASRGFANSQVPSALQPVGIPGFPSVDLKLVAEAFVSLQQHRHAADYDLARTFTREQVNGFIEQVESAFAAWNRIKSSDEARLYLGCFQLWKTWNKPR
jgi:hypothetical protein